MTIDDDRQLVAAALAGSTAAGAELFSRHWLAAWRLAFAVTRNATAADDAAQDAFERAFRALPNFNGRSSFGTWLSRIVLNRHTHRTEYWYDDERDDLEVLREQLKRPRIKKEGFMGNNPPDRVHQQAGSLRPTRADPERRRPERGRDALEDLAARRDCRDRVREWRFYVERPQDDSVWVVVARSAAGNKYLKTEADGDAPNNLLSLPECP